MDKLVELKSRAYDLIAQREYINQQLQEVNQQIAQEAFKNLPKPKENEK